MARILPFKAVRPVRAKAGLVATRPYEDYCEAEIKMQLDFNPYSFLHIINPGYKFQHTIKGERRFEMIKNRYLEFKEEEIFIQDPSPSYYIYKITNRQFSCCGIIAAASAEDYEQQVIKKHEETLTRRELLFKEYLKEVGFNTEPVLLTYSENPTIDSLLQDVMQERPEYEFATRKRETHYLWVIENADIIQRLKEEFGKISQLYIADGHHRCASSYLLAREAWKSNPQHSGKESYNFFMSYLISENNLKIYEYSRLVKDLNGHSKEEFLILLDEYFRIENRGMTVYKPGKKHHFYMYLDGEFYSLYLRKSHAIFPDPVSKLDAHILYEKVLKPILGIQEVRNDKRLAYVPGIKNSIEVKNQVDSGEFAVGFGMLPVSMDEIKEIADKNLTMPPKSTYIEPKLRSGLTIYEF